MKKLFKTYLLLSLYAMESSIATRGAMAIFIFGKLLRIALFFAFTYYIFTGTGGVLGYGKSESLVFVAYFYFISAVAQMFFREVYRFRPRVISGEFDFDLIRPVHPVLRCLLGGFDLHDLLTLPILFFVLAKSLSFIGFDIGQTFLLIFLSINAIATLFSFHVLVAGWVVMNPDVDHGLMVYRDLETMGRFPVDIYKEPLKTVLTFLLPIGLAFTLPVKTYLGLVNWPTIIFSFLVGAFSLFLSFKFWNFAIKKYSSASS
ncbi:MAG: ABC-2 family transporter protein [bacterium]|nr:ABC-2 family transporter protein [bacterium]